MAKGTETLQKENSDAENKQSKVIEDLIYLMICAVNESVPDIKRIEDMDLDALYDLAAYHSVASLVSFAIERVIDLPHQFDQAKKKAIRKLALFDIERSKIFAGFNREKIWYMPLKGIILKDYYPEYGMREMADNDVLCDPDRMYDVKSIMEELGYACEQFGWTHDVYSKNILSFEFHRTLFHEMEFGLFHDYYKNIKEKLICLNDSFEYRFTPEDFYIHITAHEYKHYINAGTGLRSLLDTYVFLKRHSEQLDWNYVDQGLKALSLSEFEKMSRELSEKVFSGCPLNDEEKRLFMYYVSSGARGTEEHAWKNKLYKELSGDVSKKSKRRHILGRIILNGEELKNRYPTVYRHKVLLPGLYIYRFVKAIITKPKEIWTEYKRVVSFNARK